MSSGMSSSSYRSGNGSRDLRYQYRLCDCGRKSKIKIVESEKPTKGMLYFVCERDECGFWSWCNPTSREQPRWEASVGKPAEEERPRMEASMMSKWQKVDEELKSLKLLICCCVMVTVFSLLVLMSKM